MNKVTLYGSESRAKILEGVRKITGAIKVTLGAMGRNVVIAQSAVIDYGVHSLPLHITKDGWTVARCFDVIDPLERVGVMMIKEVCTKTVDMAGDGTTTSAILAEAIITKGMELINTAGENPMELKKGIDLAVEYVVSELKKMAIPIGDDNEKIFQVATVSANNDAVIGRLIADAFKKIGNDGVITIEESSGVNTEIKTTDGFKIERGWGSVSQLFVNNKEKQICEFENPLILMYQNRITHHTQFQKALETATKSGRPIVFICEDAAEEGLAVLVRNNYEGRIRCCVIRAPYFGDARYEAMEDLATYTGGTYISDIKGIDIKKDITDLKHFGEAKKVIIYKDEAIFIGGSYNELKYSDVVDNLKMNKAQAKSEEEKNEIEKRIARLTGGVAVIYVGGTTETEMKEKKDRVDDAIRATKAAIAEGYVAGGGSAFLKIMDCFPFTKKGYSLGILNGARIVMSVLDEPIKQICYNAGVDAAKVIKSINEAASVEFGMSTGIYEPQPHPNIGYNAMSGKVENMLIAGIIDPAKVLRCALQNAASSAGMILTVECMITDTL